MDNSQTDTIKWNKPDAKEYVLDDSIYTKFKNIPKKFMMSKMRTGIIFELLMVLMRKMVLMREAGGG